MKFFKYIIYSLFLFMTACGGSEDSPQKESKESVVVVTKTSNAPGFDEDKASLQNEENEENEANGKNEEENTSAEEQEASEPPAPVSFEFEVISENGGKLLVIQQKTDQGSVLLVMDQNYSFDLVNRFVDISINGVTASKSRVQKIISNPLYLKNKICSAKDDEAKRYTLTHFGLTTGTIARVSSVLGENLVDSFLSDPINGGDFDGYEITSMTSGRDGAARSITLSKKGMYEDVIMTKLPNTPIRPLYLSISDYLSILENTLRQVSENEMEYCQTVQLPLAPAEPAVEQNMEALPAVESEKEAS